MEAESPGEGGGAGDGNVEHGGVDVQDILESMLSKKNLVRDQFLAGNMNPQMYIPINILLDHERLQGLGITLEGVLQAAKRSAKLGVNEQGTMVRPLLKSKRNVVILRDVPLGTTEADVRELFVGAPHADRLANIKPEVNNTWFVKFNLDEGTQDVVLWLRSQRMKGQPVNAAIKSEHFLRSFFPLHLPGQAPPPNLGYMGPRLDGGEYLDPGVQDYDGTENAGGWPTEGVPLGIAAIMPPPPPLPREGMQGPGYWQPWGARFQSPPLVFTSATTLAASSMPVVSQQAAPMGPEILDNLEAHGGEGAKGSSGKGKGKGKGKPPGGKEAYAGGKEAQYAGGKDAYCYNAGPVGAFGGKDWGGKGCAGKGWSGGGGKEWYGAASYGKAPDPQMAPAWAPPEAPTWRTPEPPAAGRGAKGAKGEKGEKGQGAPAPRAREVAGGKAVWQPVEARPQPPSAQHAVQQVAAPPAQQQEEEDEGGGAPTYTREDFMRVGQAFKKEKLVRPEEGSS